MMRLLPFVMRMRLTLVPLRAQPGLHVRPLARRIEQRGAEQPVGRHLAMRCRHYGCARIEPRQLPLQLSRARRVDLVDAASAADVEGQLSRLNPGATVMTAAHGEVAPDRLFGAALFDPARKTPDVQAWLRPERDAHHASGIRSFCLTFEDPLPWQAVSNWLRMLRQERGEDLLRVKGILHL